MNEPRFAFVAGESAEAQESKHRLQARYGQCPLEEADIIVALGGDGVMLETLHAHLERGLPIYGMNRGTVGFLMNSYREDDLPARLARAERATLHPLRMQTRCLNGQALNGLAINEVALFRETRLAARIRVTVDDVVRLDELICDGIMVATPAGSTAYNLSVDGPILPIGAPLLALTPISGFRPRRWRGALLPDTARVGFEVLNPDRRPVSATADFTEIRDVVQVQVRQDKTVSLHLLFDPEHDLEERIIREQFLT